MRINQQLIVFIFLAVGVMSIVGIVGFFAVNSTTVQSSYANFLKQPNQPRQIDDKSSELVIHKIRIINEGECGSIEIERNGTSTLIDCDDTTRLNSLLLSNEKIAKIFQNLTIDEFIELGDTYYDPRLKKSITITLETNFGTKTITISNSDSSAPPVDDTLDEIIDEIEDTEEELDDPLPSPSSVPSPTSNPGGSPTPSSSASVSPSPSGSPSPSSSPDPDSTVEPFNCAMLENQDVTVSNTRCLD